MNRRSEQPKKQPVKRKRVSAHLVKYRWKKGQSGNPGGRVKGDTAAEIARAIFEGNEEAIYKAMLKALKKGSPKVFVALAERGFGKMTQNVVIPGIDSLAESIAEARKRAG